MRKIFFPDSLTYKYYERTIKSNPKIILTGFYNGPQDEEYKKNREELRNNFRKTFLCDEWLDFFCFQENNITYNAPTEKILELAESYFGETIPLGCLMIAIKHRKEKHIMEADGRISSLYIRKRIFVERVEIMKYNQRSNNVIKSI